MPRSFSIVPGDEQIQGDRRSHQSSWRSKEQVQIRLRECAIPIRDKYHLGWEHALNADNYEGRFDALAVDHDANIIIVESKGSSRRSQREGIAQLMEYHAHLRAEFAFRLMVRIDGLNRRARNDEEPSVLSEWFSNDAESRRFLARLENRLDGGQIWLALHTPRLHASVARTIWNMQHSMGVPIVAFDDSGDVVADDCNRHAAPSATTWPRNINLSEKRRGVSRGEFLPVIGPRIDRRIQPPFARALSGMERDGFPVRRTPLGAGIGRPVGLFMLNGFNTLEWWGLRGDEQRMAQEAGPMGATVIVELDFDYGMFGIGSPWRETMPAYLTLMKEFARLFPAL